MLTIKKLTSEDSFELDKVNYLYDMAFPAFEKRSHSGRQTILKHANFHLYYFSNNDVFVGFVGGWQFDDFFYIEHFAISSELRGQGYGQKALMLLCQKVTNIILEIEPVVDEITQKRLRFYSHCGFKENSFQHVHPNYHSEYQPHELEILSFPSSISEDSYQQFNDKLTKVVMHPDLL
ncbi:GNAT family N-acetyltransferase [Providencia sneebia]|uniref:Putative acyltransferase domain protein n=1 Tax=Providencia sneebia DSM 19967 TaxID=1141660 RepID=K8WDM5_9GAMM|nr:GNAT family N-acetyltransferase [Providencia sneebia]EKT55562.1 putative acyltransferase domain protein [Providencia sneebia DSM 19967]